MDLCTEGIFLPGHITHSFIQLSLLAPSSSTFDLFASLVSTVNLHCNCLPTLLQALATMRPDQEIWLLSYYKEKNAIESLWTFFWISLGEYRALWEKGAPKVITTMCVLTIKKDENLMPLWAKSWIVTLGNQEECDWSKSDHFAPILCFDSLRFLVSLTVQHQRSLKQGD